MLEFSFLQLDSRVSQVMALNDFFVFINCLLAPSYTSDFDNIIYDRPEIELHLPHDKFKSQRYVPLPFLHSASSDTIGPQELYYLSQLFLQVLLSVQRYGPPLLQHQREKKAIHQHLES